jgi:hypothetical protein
MAARPKTIIMTGGTEEFYPFVRECVDSLIDVGVLERADLGLIDHGWTPEQVASFRGQAKTIVKPTYADLGMRIPENLQLARSLNLVARSDLPSVFPGYDVYLWFDADAWAQTADFFDVYVDAAARTGFAVAKDEGYGYKVSAEDRRWWVGNYMLGFGVIDGLRGGLLNKAVNIGMVAIHRDAPHWARYRQRHQATIDKTGKINLDQHACHAALVLDKLPVEYVPATCNWQTTLSMPQWDPKARVLREPRPGGEVLSVIHLAGKNKRDIQTLRTTDGGTTESALTYHAIKRLRAGSGVKDTVAA